MDQKNKELQCIQESLVSASQAWKLLTESKGAVLTEIQSDKLKKYEEMILFGKMLTDNQQNEYFKLKEKRDTKPELSETAKSYVREIWLRRTKGVKRYVKSKYLEKGLYKETEAIGFLALVDEASFYEKNTTRKDNGIISGECDLYNVFEKPSQLPIWYPDKSIQVFPKRVIQDTKVSWDAVTFMESKLSKEYETQGQVYMELYDADEFWLRYVLLDCPEHLYNNEEYKFKLDNNIDLNSTEDSERLEEFRRSLIYSENPTFSNKERVKTFTVKRDPKVIDDIYDKMELVMEYYKSLSLNGYY